jgi:holin-like protein
MAFFFLPAGIGIMEKYQLLQGKIIPFLLICLLTTVLTFFTTSLSMRLILALQKKGGSNEGTDC